MKHGPLIFLGVLSAVLASWVGAVVAPHFQIGSQELVALDNLGIEYPLDRLGEAKQGAAVYRAQGCNYCHTQQVLQEPLLSVLTLVDPGTNDAAVAGALLKIDPNLGPDLRRGWGSRRTVSRDYLRDQPVLLGQVRFGPDLANIGARQTNTTRLLLKLYNARIEMPGSTMPRYPYLFEERKLRPGHPPSPEALPLPASFAPPPGIEIVPTWNALRLVAYLQSLKSDQVFYEVFPPQPRTNAVGTAAAATNAPPAETNAPSAATNASAAGTNVPSPGTATNVPAPP